MALSLTEEEFRTRLAKRKKLFITAINRDVKDLLQPIKVDLQPGQTEIKLNINEQLSEMLIIIVDRAISLVYLDNVD
ncbi:hypothetical protein ACFLXY_03365 [Chloroflexota bacterium]